MPSSHKESVRFKIKNNTHFEKNYENLPCLWVKKLILAEDHMRDLKRQNSRTNNGDFKLMEKTKSSYESTMERVDLNFWNKHIWIIQVFMPKFFYFPKKFTLVFFSTVICEERKQKKLFSSTFLESSWYSRR